RRGQPGRHHRRDGPLRAAVPPGRGGRRRGPRRPRDGRGPRGSQNLNVSPPGEQPPPRTTYKIKRSDPNVPVPPGRAGGSPVREGRDGRVRVSADERAGV